MSPVFKECRWTVFLHIFSKFRRRPLLKVPLCSCNKLEKTKSSSKQDCPIDVEEKYSLACISQLYQSFLLCLASLLSYWKLLHMQLGFVAKWARLLSPGCIVPTSFTAPGTQANTISRGTSKSWSTFASDRQINLVLIMEGLQRHSESQLF